MSGVALFDADGTLYPGFCIFPLYEYYAERGFVTPGQNETFQKVIDTYTNGEVDYATFVRDTLVIGARAVAGCSPQIADQLAAEFFARKDMNWFGYVRPTLAKFGEAGIRKVLITAEPQFIGYGIARALKLDYFRTSLLGVNGDVFDGTVISALGSKQKGEIARDLVQDHHQSLAFGDSGGDIDMLRTVTDPYCIQPTEDLRKVAEVHQWNIIDNPNSSLKI